jgi:hypothetical protein
LFISPILSRYFYMGGALRSQNFKYLSSKFSLKYKIEKDKSNEKYVEQN